jgi:hypothetical protein
MRKERCLIADGLVQVMEANGTAVSGDGEREVDGGGKGGKRNWYDSGVDVSVFLEKEAMGRLLRDVELRKHERDVDVRYKT